MSQKCQWIIELQPIDRQQGKHSYLGVLCFQLKSIAGWISSRCIYFWVEWDDPKYALATCQPFRYAIPSKYSNFRQDYDFSAAVRAAVHRSCLADVRGHLRSSGETEIFNHECNFRTRVADLLSFQHIPFHFSFVQYSLCPGLVFHSPVLISASEVKSDYYRFLFCECGFEWEKWADRCSMSSKNKYGAVFASLFAAFISVLEFVAWLPTSPVGWSIIGLMQTVVSVPPLLLRAPTTSAVCVCACVCDAIQRSYVREHGAILSSDERQHKKER